MHTPTPRFAKCKFIRDTSGTAKHFVRNFPHRIIWIATIAHLRLRGRVVFDVNILKNIYISSSNYFKIPRH